jgi:hypothetical protein
MYKDDLLKQTGVGKPRLTMGITPLDLDWYLRV